MKTLNLIVLALLFITLLMSCENPIRLETIVHEDGSLEKTIVLEKADSLAIATNYFGVNEAKGWALKREELKKDGEKSEFKIEFKKSFPSTEAVNKELDMESDTLFRIHSEFKKSFRWFYTYLRYSETFRPMDKLKLIKAEDYFTQEDKAFIDRLPGEGTAVSNADSIYLQFLNEKIYDHYATRGLFNEQFSILAQVVEQNSTDKKWLDTLKRNKEFLYRKMESMDEEPSELIKIIDSLGIRLPQEKATRDFIALSKPLNSRISFMAFAHDGQYTNIITMPWEVYDSNADSVAANTLYWKPLATKFAIQEYTMFAEARRLNGWAVALSLAIVALTLFLYARKNRPL